VRVCHQVDFALELLQELRRSKVTVGYLLFLVADPNRGDRLRSVFAHARVRFTETPKTGRPNSLNQGTGVFWLYDLGYGALYWIADLLLPVLPDNAAIGVDLYGVYRYCSFQSHKIIR